MNFFNFCLLREEINTLSQDPESMLSSRSIHWIDKKIH